MCEKRIKKIKKVSHLIRQRETRRLQRLRAESPVVNTPEPVQVLCPQPRIVDKAAQNRVLLELAWKTVGLMQKNRVIQQKLLELQKETSEFIASMMKNPENKRRYLEQVRLKAQNNSLAVPKVEPQLSSIADPVLSVNLESGLPFKLESDV